MYDVLINSFGVERILRADSLNRCVSLKQRRLASVLLLRRFATDEFGHALVGTKQSEDAFARFGRQDGFQEDHGVHQSVLVRVFD